MPIDYTALPVYEQKQRILETLAGNQVIVVQSPTGSGKTTQIPVILHEAGYSESGIIAVTQPRRIAALSVSEFIARQLKTSYPGLVGYKMRFEDKTDSTTRIKIMTDGILLQEMKLDPWLSRYSVVMVDEAHERSLNIDFVLGLLKRVLAQRQDFKVIVSSATMNTEAFSHYFDGCPVVTIDTITYPVTVVYDSPPVPVTTATAAGCSMLLDKIEDTVSRVLDNRTSGGMLCFLPGEKIIKDCIRRLSEAPFSRKIHLIPLYGRLAKEEQERVFDAPPFGKKKIIVSTNIAETSVTIPDITTVIDSGLAKLNYYNPRTYTSSLNETPVSKASCNQRKGRAGRTQPGVCYRLYSRKDYESRPLYTLEEIYRTDLSEVVLRMSELGITDFDSFDFISPPGKEGMIGAVQTLRLLKALNPDNTLSPTGKLMAEFPLAPRQSRIIVESILHAPDVLEEVLIAAAFLSAQSPFVLPPGEEMDARRAHHSFRDMQGDFVSYIKLFRTYTAIKNTEKFCKNNYLDERVMAEIKNIKEQLEQIVTDLGIPVTGGGSMDDYLCCIAAGMIQFVCVREGKEQYRSLTAEHIQIHPGSSMFRSEPLYIVAGEIVRTSRMFAMSVSPLTKKLLARIDEQLEERLEAQRTRRRKTAGGAEFSAGAPEQRGKGKRGRKAGESDRQKDTDAAKHENRISIGGVPFEVLRVKGKKQAQLPYEQLKRALAQETDESRLAQVSGMRGALIIDGQPLLAGKRIAFIIQVLRTCNLMPASETGWKRKLSVHIEDADAVQTLIGALDAVLRVARIKAGGKALGFICLYTDGHGSYWFKAVRSFSGALQESIASLESLIDDTIGLASDAQKERISTVYRRLTELFQIE